MVPSSYRMILSFFFTMMFVLVYFDQHMITTLMTMGVVETTTTQQQQQVDEDAEEQEDTAIIITSSWIPSHPSTFLIDSVLNSTWRHLIGLAPSAPIFITIDSMPPTSTLITSPLEDKIEKLEQYIGHLYQKYLIHPHVHILPSVQHLHIGGSVMKALQLIELHYPHVLYVYSLQHDFPFSKDVDHVALRNVMKGHPEKVNWIRFPKRDPNTMRSRCGSEDSIWYNRTFTTISVPNSTTTAVKNTTKISHNDRTNKLVPSPWEPMQLLQLIPTSSYSDNNHLTRLAWYKEVFASLVMLTRPPEFPLQVRANAACKEDRSMGLYIYHEVCLEHLDGKHNVQFGGGQ